MSTQNWSEDPVIPVPATPGSNSPGSPGGSQPSSTQAKDEAKNLSHEGADAAKGVAKTAGAEAKNVVSEAGTQAKNLLGELGSDLKSQAGEQQQKVTEGLRSLSDELKSMAEKTDEDGPAKHLVQQAADRTGSAAGWLEGRDPGSLLDEVKGYARSHPGTFLMVAAGAGLLAGRLTRNLSGSSHSGSGNTSTGTQGGSPSRTPMTPPAGTRTPAHAAPVPSDAQVLDPADTYPTVPPGTPPNETLPGRREIR
ncbi:hypothetical protein ACX80T_10260 [Arthrobacter sp. Sr33]